MKRGDRLEQLQRFLEMDPGDSFTRYALALEYISRKDPEKGIALLKETLERDPAYVPAYHMLGQQLALLGDHSAACESFTTGIEVARSQGEIHAASEMQDALDDLQ